MHYFYCMEIPYISIRTVCASKGIIIIDYGMIVLITTTSIKMKGYPGLPMLGYFIQSSEYHVIPVQAKDDYASRNQQDYILKSKSCVNIQSSKKFRRGICQPSGAQELSTTVG